MRHYLRRQRCRQKATIKVFKIESVSLAYPLRYIEDHALSPFRTGQHIVSAQTQQKEKKLM